MARLIAAGAAAILLACSGARYAAADPWPDYQIIIWQSQSPQVYESLRKLGITAGAVEMRRVAGMFDPEMRDLLVGSHLRFFIENIATDFYAPYYADRRTMPSGFVFPRFLADRRLISSA